MRRLSSSHLRPWFAGHGWVQNARPQSLVQGRPMNEKNRPISAGLTAEDTKTDAALLLEQQIKAQSPKMDPALRRSLARLGASIAIRDAEKVQEAQTQPAKVIRLPVWPDATRGVPNVALRSALFGAIRRGPRNYLQAQPVSSLNGITVMFSGPRLDQSDLDVWEQCLHLAKDQGLGCEIRFSAHNFLKGIGRCTGKKDHEWLKSAFRRLMSSMAEFEEGRYAYAGPLLNYWARDQETGQHVIVLNPGIVQLYGNNGWTQIEWQQRLALKGQPLAQWLHGFYSSHAEPYPMKVETLLRLCGSEANELFHFRSKLRKALEYLSEVAGWNWKIDPDDLVVVSRKPSPSQQRHLARKSRKSHSKLP